MAVPPLRGLARARTVASPLPTANPADEAPRMGEAVRRRRQPHPEEAAQAPEMNKRTCLDARLSPASGRLLLMGCQGGGATDRPTGAGVLSPARAPHVLDSPPAGRPALRR